MWFMKQIYRRILVALTALTALHIVVLWNEPTDLVELNFTVPGGLTGDIDQVVGWQRSSAGLVIPADLGPDDPATLRIGVWKSRFHDLILTVDPTTRGHGRVVIRLLDDQVTSVSLSSPFQSPSNPAWRLIQGRPSNQTDLTGLQSQSGAANLAWAWPDTTAGYIDLERTAGATGPLVRSLQIERRVAPWTYLLVPLFWLPVVAMSVGAIDLLNHLRLKQFLVLCCFAVGLVTCLLPLEILEYGHVLTGVVAVQALALALHRKQHHFVPPWVLLLLLSLAASTRFTAYQTARHEPLDPDAAGFLRLASSSSVFYDTEFREPLFVALVKIATLIFGPTDAAVRAASMTGSLVLVPVVWWAGKRIFGPRSALIAAALVAASDEWSGQAVRGLRLEWFTICITLLTALLFRPPAEPTCERRYTVLLTGIAVCTCLLRITSLWFVVTGVVVRSVVDRQWKPASFVLPVLTVAVLPFFLHSHQTYGDPFFAMNQHIRFYRNQEFKDQPGFPSSEELQQNAYAGSPTTALDYFFRQHTLTELARRTVTQFYSLFAGNKLSVLVGGGHRFLFLWAVAAVAFCCLQHGRLAIWTAMLVGPVVWLYSPTSEPEWRLIFHVSPLIYLCMGELAVQTLRAADATGSR